MNSNTLFHIGDNLVLKGDVSENTVYIVSDIIYSEKSCDWFYRYSYYDGGYEHYCENTKKWVESNMMRRSYKAC